MPLIKKIAPQNERKGGPPAPKDEGQLMDVLREHQRARQHYYDEICNELGTSEMKAVKDIIHILENLESSIAGTVSLLHICEHILYMSTPVLRANPSEE